MHRERCQTSALFIGILFYSIKALKYGHCLNRKYNRPVRIFTNHSREHSSSFSLRYYKFEGNTISDGLNHMV